MEDSFRVRVDRTFGSLLLHSSSSSSNPNPHPSSSSSISNSANLASLWSLTDDEIERKEWNRDKRCSDDEDEPVVVVSNPYTVSEPSTSKKRSSFTLDDLKADIQELLDESDDDDEYQNQNVVVEKVNPMVPSSSQMEKPDDYDQDEWDVRTSVGLDSTLDLEDEEDTYDQVAIGKEAGDLYWKDITDYEADMEPSRELPKTFRDVRKDPRANRIAAQIRLKEDAEAALNRDEKLDAGDLKSILKKDGDHMVATNFNEKMDAGDLKSSLMKRDDRMLMKSEKRVTFEPGYDGENGQDSGKSTIVAMEESPMPDVQACPSVPDHVRNPSKYTHYTFDSLTDVSEESNKNAYMDLFNMLRGQRTTETMSEEDRYLPKTVTFTPKKKPVDSSMKNWTFITDDKRDGNEESMLIPLGIATEDSEICAMEEDDKPQLLPGNRSVSLPKAGRRYRSKSGINLDDPVS